MEIFISTFSLIVSIILATFYIADRKHAKFNVESLYWTELLSWYFDTSLTLKKLNTPQIEECERHSLLATLSALIDKGRFYFPNLDRGDQFGEEKPAAFQGYRHLALEYLVAAYRLHSNPQHKGQSALSDELSRRFTSITFEVIQPKKRFQTLSSLTDHFYQIEKSVEDLIEKHDRDLVEAILGIKQK